MSNRQKKVSELVLDLTPSSLQLLKRAQLQQYCKRLSLRGTGKNTELIQRLKDHLKKAGSSGQKSPQTPPPATQDVTQEEQTGGRGWCVIHGQELTTDRWFQLSLICGRACVTNRDSYVTLHLVLSSSPTPPGLPDNLICGECMVRNQEKDDRVQQKSALPGGRGWCVIHGQELTTDRWFQLSLLCGRACVTNRDSYVTLHLVLSSSPTPPGLPDNLICGECMVRNQEKDDRVQQKSALPEKSFPNTGLQKSGAVGASRSRNKSGRFQPQEDPDYARRVDELLDQMASGQVDSQKVLQPIRPAVFHSPLGKQEFSPIPINP
ncbi:uncharacterized protein LOC142697892 [Rhinoderma darwinii]|uniref:uncharacterized protein LOC142697892 n=1 Tax=Rhinoderma darwinii TaxID=43563 RepID=UPI003F669038